MTLTFVMPDKARDIAHGYWRQTPHCFQGNYPDKEICIRCGMLEGPYVGLHLPVTAKRQPTVTQVIELRSGSYEIHGSCGHAPLHRTFHDRRNRPEKVGEKFDCWSCETEWQDENFKALPHEVFAQINALIPRCPQCDEPMKYLPFITFTKHDVSYEIDGCTGALDGFSEVYDTLDEQPEWSPTIVSQVNQLPDGWQTGEIAVSCENNHEWKTRRLAWKHGDTVEHNWRILD